MNATGITAVIHGVITAVLNLTFDSAYFTSAVFVHIKNISFLFVPMLRTVILFALSQKINFKIFSKKR